MNCQIIRNPKTNKITRVNASNGNESILYKSILESLPNKIELDEYLKEALSSNKIKDTTPEELALGMWSKVYTSNFKNWFGDSKVVDKNGEPMLVHHGSKELKSQFVKKPKNHINQGLFFTTKKNETRHYGNNIISGFLKIKNIEKLNGSDYLNGNLSENNDGGFNSLPNYTGKGFETNGIYINYVVKEPNQIKSVFNNGDFNVQSGNIYYQLSDTEVNDISPSLEKSMRELVEAVGGKINIVDTIKDENGKTVNAYGKMNALNNIIELVNTGRPKDTLVEETAHMITALLGPNHPLMKQMMNNITSFEVYHDVKKEYADTYNTEEDFRFEAVGKLISKHIIKGEALGSFDRKEANNWFQRVINKLAEMFYGKKLDHVPAELNAFEKAASLFRSKEILNDIKPAQSIPSLAKEFNMSTSGFIDGKNANIDELKIKANKVGVNVRTSENGNYYFTKNGAKINPFQDFYQLKENKTQEEIIKSLLDTHAKVAPDKHIYVDENGIQRETYKFHDGHIVQNRVSGLQDKKFNRNKTAQEIIDANNDPKNIIFREVGVELHDINEEFLKIGVSLRDNLQLTAGVTIPTSEPKGTSTISKAKVNVLGKSINQLLEDIEVIQKNIDPDKKATIITENFVHDSSKDIAGSQDVLVVFSDGSAAIYDYKFINFTKGTSKEAEIPFAKRNSYHLQISEYKRILKDVYGIKHFRETRILPFSIQYVFEKTSTTGIKKEVKSIEGFDKDSNKAYLVPLPVANEITSDKKLNEILTSLFNREQILTKKISQNWMNPTIKNPLIDELELTKKSIKAIQIKSDVEPLIKSINKSLSNLAKISKDATIESINELALMDAEIKLFKSIYSNASSFIEDNSKEEFNDISIRLVKAENVIKDKLEEILLTLHPDVNVPQREMDTLASNFNTMSDMNHPIFEAARKLIATSFGDTRRMMDDLLEELEVKKTNLDTWAKAKGITLLDAYKQITNEKTGNLKGKFSSNFHETAKAKRKEGDSQWFKDNYEYTDVGKALYKENLKLYESSLEGNGDKFKEYKLKEWKDSNDLSQSKAWTNMFAVASYTELKNPEKHYSDSYKELLQDNNKPLKEFYDYYIETNRWFNSIVDDKIDSNFVANISKDLIDSIAHGDNTFDVLKNTKSHFINGLKVRQNDNITIEGEDKNVIPLLYKDTFSYRDKNGNWIDGADSKSLDLATNMALFGESVFNKHNMSKISGTIEGLRLLINNQKIIKTNNFGKVQVDPVTGEVIPVASEKNTNAKTFEAQVDALVYGKRIQNKDRHVTIGSDTISMNKLVANVMSYMSTKSLALNYVSGLGNFFGAYSNAYIKGIGGKYYTSKQMRESHKLQFSRSDKDLYNHIKEFWNVGNPHWAKDQAMNLSMSKLTKNLTFEKWYILQEKGDEFVANSILVSMMQNYGLDENGTPTRLELLPENTKSLYDRIDRSNDKFNIEGLDNEGFDDFRKMVLYVSKQVKGTANPEDISMIQTHIFGKSLMHFKSWIAPMVKERYGDLKYTPEVKEWEFGRYRSFFSQLLTKKFIPNMMKLSLDVLTFGKIRYKGDRALLTEQFTKWENDNPDMKGKLTEEDYLDLRERTIRESIHELKILASMFILILAAKGDWDDDGEADYKKNVVTRQLFKILNRSYLELSFFTNPTSFKDLIKTPIPMVQVGVDLTNFGTNTVDEVGDVLFGEDKVDNTGKGHYTKRLFPIASPLFSFLEDFNEE